MSLDTKAQAIKLILLDVDGVLTDGKILLHADGSESKVFDIKDGTAIVWAQRSGVRVGFLSARSSAATAQRAAQLGVTIVHQGVSSKLDAYLTIVDHAQVTEKEVAYMGDDVLDLPVLLRVGMSAAPADAASDVRTRVDLLTVAAGGGGAVRELIEVVLRAQAKWIPLVDAYAAQGQHA
jgi:3-deoxy-D-manno-octulosonate 8-phosphate phosphatase (KDO 8-P phosphatase)